MTYWERLRSRSLDALAGGAAAVRGGVHCYSANGHSRENRSLTARLANGQISDIAIRILDVGGKKVQGLKSASSPRNVIRYSPPSALTHRDRH
jgi:hypothetical protein